MFYDAVNASQKQVEVIYVSRDKNPDQFNEYYSEMPWIAVPFEDKARIAALGARYQIQQIPALILIDNQGNMKRNTCRMDVTNKGPLCLADWDQALSR
jgi:nucleoredoxin